MALRFAVRGTQKDAWFGYSGGVSSDFSNLGYAESVDVTTNVHAGVFGGKVLNMVPASVIKGMVWPGRLNVGVAGDSSFSVLARIVPRATESPFASGFGIIECANARGPYKYGFRVGINGAGKVFLQTADDAGNILTVASTQVLAAVANTPMDIMLTWDGTTTAGHVKISKNGVEWDTMTAPSAVISPFRDAGSIRDIICGSISSTSGQNSDLNELLLWNSVENHVYATRTDFWNVAAFDGSHCVDPGQDNVRDGTDYTIDGVAKTGNVRLPVAGNVLIGTEYDSTNDPSVGTGKLRSQTLVG